MSSLTTDHDPAAGVPAAIRSFVDDEIVPYAGEWDRAERIPRDVLDRICELGLWAPFLPEAHGGAALPWTEVGRLHEEVGRGCSAVRSLLTVHTMVAGTVLRWGTDEQRARWLPLLARGEPLGAFCLSEPDSGSAADDRRKRNRTFIDPVTEVPRLEHWFSLNTHPSHSLVLRYTDELNRQPYRLKFPKLEPKNVQFWFKNRRAKCKRLKLSL